MPLAQTQHSKMQEFERTELKTDARTKEFAWRQSIHRELRFKLRESSLNIDFLMTSDLERRDRLNRLRGKKILQFLDDKLMSTLDEESFEAEALNVVLLGKTGCGKSSIANALFDTNGFSVERCSLASATQKCRAAIGKVFQQRLLLVDTPGTLDTNDDEKALREVSEALTYCPGGIHVFCLVLRLDVPFTKEEDQAVKQLETIFTFAFYKYAVVVFTHADEIGDVEKCQDSIRATRSDIPQLDLLLKRCGERFFLLDARNNSSLDKQQLNLQRLQARNIVTAIADLSDANETPFKNSIIVQTNQALQAENEKLKKEVEDLKQRERTKAEEELVKLRRQPKPEVFCEEVRKMQQRNSSKVNEIIERRREEAAEKVKKKINEETGRKAAACSVM